MKFKRIINMWISFAQSVIPERFNRGSIDSRLKRAGMTSVLLITLTFPRTSWAALDVAQLTDLVEQLQKTVSQLHNTASAQNEKIGGLEGREPRIEAAPSSG